MVRFAKPHVSVISTDLGRNIMVLISLDFTKGNLIVRFGIPLISVIFKNSAAVTNTLPGIKVPSHNIQSRFVFHPKITCYIK